ncbi:hypothetical protein SAMN06265795_103308 [Noviherbaspirillum humi]|uniref:Uncharacterized protein n=1 Tax=Noviherbaspirillum humi TaxID=1688639 RepID=A0A239FFH9_9BURK|nr:hypothetical protein [Noviherbaspirillum humi]SNS54922.1 hypothetical protein SAMN06265795_103308 [Noviherbaspirillum humi]
MEFDNNPAIIALMRRMKRDGKTSADILYVLVDYDLNVSEMMCHFWEAFNLKFDDVTCIGGWSPDGSGELSDEAISAFIDPEIARKWVDEASGNRQL